MEPSAHQEGAPEEKMISGFMKSSISSRVKTIIAQQTVLMQERKDLVNLVGKRYGQLKGEEPCADVQGLSKADHVRPVQL